jgi:serine/threonine protein kinase
MTPTAPVRPGPPVLCDYEVLDKIADGSMACVYRGRRRRDGTLVALKVPLPSVVNNPVLLERFQQEFRAGSTLCHDNLVRALDFGQEGETFFLVMEFVDGQDLWERIVQGGRLPEAEAVQILCQAAQGLDAAHKHGLIHRDVKPDNILLAANGRVKLGDLGLIKDLENELGLTCTRKGLGTPNFIAPEQFSAARHADVRCDVYGLGATLYMAVTGEPPFPGPSLAAVLRKKLANDLVPPRQLVPGLSERLDWAVRRALQADPGRRQASCQEFIRSLTAADGAPEPAARPRPARPGRERRGSVRYPCTRVTVCSNLTSIHDGEDESLEKWEATVQDLSVTGVGLFLRRRFEPGTTVTVTLESPDRQHRRTLALQVTRVAQGRGGWVVGGHFTRPLEKAELVQLL